MFSLFLRTVCICFCLQSTLSTELVVILASDKESLKKSLAQVDQFLQKVGQRIQNERNFLQTVGKGNNNSPKDTEGEEDYASLWFGSKGKDKKNDKPSLRQDFSGYSNFVKALANLNENDTRSTKKLVHAVADLKDLVKDDNIVNKPDRGRSKKIDNVALRKLQEELMNLDPKKMKMRRIDGSSDEEEKVGFDEIFHGMDFPKDSEFPMEVSIQTTQGEVSMPDVLAPDFVTNNDNSGPNAGAMSTLSTTTDVDEQLLDPKEFGYTTTLKPMAVYGDITGTPFIDKHFLTTKKPDDPFVGSLKKDMVSYSMGVFSIAILKIFHMTIWKKADDVKSMLWGFRRVIENMITFNQLKDLGPVTQAALDDLTTNAYRMPYDQLKTQAIMLHHALLHRREMFGADLNYVMDELDSIYVKQETDELLKSLEPLDQFNDPKRTPFKQVQHLINCFLAPIKRLNGAPRREGLIIAMTKAIKNHFYATKNIPVRHERRNARKMMYEIIPRPTVKKKYIKKYAIWRPTTYAPKTVSNKYKKDQNNTTKLTTIKLKDFYEKLFKTKFGKSNLSNPNITKNNKQNANNMIDIKPNEKLYSVANDILKSKIINLINTNTDDLFNTGVDNINDKAKEKYLPPQRAIFRTGDYVDENSHNNTVLNDDMDIFGLDMYKDYTDNVVSEPPATEVINFKVNENEGMMIEDNKKPSEVEQNLRMGNQGHDIQLKMSQDKSKHHKRHHHYHKKHRHHKSLKQKLAKIKRILKLYRSGTHRRRFRHKHHHHSKHGALRSHGKHKGYFHQPFTKEADRNLSIFKALNDRRSRKKKVKTKPTIAELEFYEYTTQVYEVKDKFNKFGFRRNLEENLKKFVETKLARRASVETDDEIPLKTNLYKALGQGMENKLVPRAQAVKRNPLRESSGSDEEALLKNKLYNYFNNIQHD